ncbi:unnamed protein product [Xylocopa violacea]|uniref:Uncharacterized protein n=1 Tax=Xylocopa violacea TaxID=135666 RepID=A0ABP1P7F1_XYLVO
MKIVCAAKNCKYSSDNEDSEHVMFINFPNDDFSKIWAHHCGRPDLLMKSNEELHLNYYICSHHIEDCYYISKTDPVLIDQNAIPTLFDSQSMIEKDTRSTYNENECIEINDNVVSPYCDMDVELDQYRDTNKFSYLCRICGEPPLSDINIFSPKGIKLKLKEKISLLLPITIDKEDLMPQKLCTYCYRQLEIAHSLVVTSLRTDMRLKKFLNIDDKSNYDQRYSAIVKKCSMEVGKMMNISEASESTSMELLPNKTEGTSIDQEMIQKFSHFENTNENNLANNTRRDVKSNLNDFTETPSKDSKGDEYVTSTTRNYPTNELPSNEIQCIHCKGTFKTQEIFEAHKILCAEGEIEIQKVKGTKSNESGEESNTVTALNFQFVTKTCSTCNEHFESEKQFAEHKLTPCKFLQEQRLKVSNKRNENEESCNVCKDPHTINNIVPTESNKRCGHCDLVYNTKKELLNHIVECHGGQLLFKCIMCDKTYEKWSSLDVHEATHRIDKPYLCDLCGKSFKHSNNLRGHKRTHLDDSKKKRHVCEICGTAFRSRFHLGEHMNQHNGRKPYSCEKCGKPFYKRIQLRQHKLSHGLNKHVCPICSTAFNRKGNMNAHLKRHNSGNDAYTCSVCAHSCKSMSELKLHRKIHTEEDIIESIRKKGLNKTIWQCKTCNRVFSTQSVLLNHERIHNEERPGVECNICGKKLASKNSLTYHQNSIHSSVRPHMCQYCGASFVSKEAWLVHERVHTGERPYVCKICKREYKNSSNLNQHTKTHSGLKPYRCVHCNKRFTRKGALNVHERVHTGEKPFTCVTCGRTFSQKNDMIKHTKTHVAKSLRCEQCDEVFAKKKDILKHMESHEQNEPVAQEYVEVQQEIAPYSMDMLCSQFE